MPLYLPGEQIERDPPPERPPGDPERGKHPGPERKRTTRAPSPGDRPGDRETETSPAALHAVVIAVTHARKPAAPPVLETASRRQNANRHMHLFLSAYFIFHLNPRPPISF